MEGGGHQPERILSLARVCSQEGITKQQVNAGVDLSNCFPSLPNKLESPRIQKQCSDHQSHLSMAFFMPCHSPKSIKDQGFG